MVMPALEQRLVDPSDVSEPLERLFRDLRSGPEGLTAREAERRLAAYGPNELARRGGAHWPRQLARQLTHPLALLLFLAAGLAFAAGTTVLALAILAVVVLNALFAFGQERQAERAVEALRNYLPQRASVRRDGERVTVAATELVPGDLLYVEEGERVSADARLVDGSIEVDLSTLTGESQPVLRAAGLDGGHRQPLDARDMIFSGSAVVSGDARGLVHATDADRARSNRCVVGAGQA